MTTSKHLVIQHYVYDICFEDILNSINECIISNENVNFTN
ncbi:MAG: hypothetical protein ACI9Y7_001739 [Dokdonia sp.]|jgi:hypothetical protein